MEKELRNREKVSYTSSLVGQNMMYNFMAMYIMFFFTDLLGILPAIATSIIVIASFWDAINDPLMGMIADKTRTRWGKFRPYLIFAPIVLFVTTVLCYIQFNFGTSVTIIVAATSYVLWGMTFTVIDIPIWAISAVVSKKASEKNTMITLGKIGGVIGTAIVTVGSIIVINSFGGERSATAYTITAVIVAAIACISIFITGLTLRERIIPDKKVIPMKQNIQTITKNKPLILLMITLRSEERRVGTRESVQMYFVVYVWGDSSLLTDVGISLVVGMILGMAITPKFIKKWDKKLIYIAACLFGSIFSAVPFFVGSANILFSLIFIGLSFLFTGIAMIVSASMLIDAVDYSEWKLGFRGEGLIFSANTFITKLSGTIARGILGIGLILMNYTEGQPTTPILITGFNAMVFLIPAIIFLLTMIPLFFYKITTEQKESIQNMLEEKYQKQHLKEA